MSECKLDHSLEDVRKKLAEQAPFLPEQLSLQLQAFLTESLTQETLNEVFHLLKKYDLSSPDERQIRDEKIKALVSR